MWKFLSHVRLFATPWTVAHQASLSMGILQARILKWVAISLSRGCSQPRNWTWSPALQEDYFTFWGTRKAWIINSATIKNLGSVDTAGTWIQILALSAFESCICGLTSLSLTFFICTTMCVCVCVSACSLSHIQLFVTPWTVACQAPLSMEFSRQEYWSGLPFTSPGDLPNPGIEPASLVSPALAGGFFTSWAALPYKIMVEIKWDNPRNTLHVVNIL